MAEPETAADGAVPPAQPPALVGQVLDGRYRILRKLGEGGMGEVYSAEGVHIAKQFAIKVLRQDIASGTDAMFRFRWDASRAASIGHRNIAAIEDFGVLSDGRIYVCMELLAGAALDPMFTRPIGDDRLLEILIQTGDGLAAAHARGIVHGDLKPANIFVTIGPGGDDVPKLLDFGLARVWDRGGQNHRTRTGTISTISGTPSYLAPEQVRGKPVDARTDVYAVGVIMYEGFSGTLPFQGDSVLDVLSQHITMEPEPVAQRAARAGRQLPPGLAETITRCLQKDPARRFQTMDELVGALTQVYRGVVRPGATRPMEGYSPATAELARSPAARPIALDENVQFTVYRPRAIDPDRWHSLLAFAHLAERRPGELDAPDPIAEVSRQAEAVLGERAAAYQSTTQDSGAAIPANGELVFAVELPGIEVNPPRRSFLWTEPVHREEFRIRATAQLAGTTARGRLTVFLGCIVIAELPLAVRVDATHDTAVEHTQVRAYRRIFASYSHRDAAIVDQFEQYARALGDEYLRDSVNLRAGEVWSDQLRRMIEQADAFQLFWSRHSMHSLFVRQEYEHALSLNRPSFVRPTYWEVPMPTADGLPPEPLLRLHFQKLGGIVAPVQMPCNEAPEIDAPRGLEVRHAEPKGWGEPRFPYGAPSRLPELGSGSLQPTPSATVSTQPRRWIRWSGWLVLFGLTLYLLLRWIF
jgi:hypothetical protein